jgi:glycerate kinase
VLLVAPDSFKGTFSAAQVAAAVARGAAAAGMPSDACPLADGGEGTIDVVLVALRGIEVPVRVHDPLGREIDASFGWVDAPQPAAHDGPLAIVEMARASGLGLVAPDERDALRASTGGTGELIAAAVARGAREIVVTVGGSATSDGGAGAIAAIDAAGGTGDARLLVVCDVTTPFERAAAVYGPQKGADPPTVQRLTARLHEQAAALPRDPRGVPMTGAAGGLSGGLWARYGAELAPGAAWVLDTLGVDHRIARATAVVTGEGRLDAQTLEGKLIGELAARCAAARTPLHAIVGSSTLADPPGLASVRAATTLPELEAAGHALAASLTPPGAPRCRR